MNIIIIMSIATIINPYYKQCSSIMNIFEITKLPATMKMIYLFLTHESYVMFQQTHNSPSRRLV